MFLDIFEDFCRYIFYEFHRAPTWKLLNSTISPNQMSHTGHQWHNSAYLNNFRGFCTAVVFNTSHVIVMSVLLWPVCDIHHTCQTKIRRRRWRKEILTVKNVNWHYRHYGIELVFLSKLSLELFITKHTEDKLQWFANLFFYTVPPLQVVNLWP